MPVGELSLNDITTDRTYDRPTVSLILGVRGLLLARLFDVPYDQQVMMGIPEAVLKVSSHDWC